MNKAEKNITDFEYRIGVRFKDKSLLKQAFVHRSYLNENPDIGLPHNERLEFLGDAVLELAATDYLFHHYPEKTEGELTAYRAALVNTQSISRAARELGMNECLLLSRGEAKDTGRAREYILANTFEAVVGAIYLDQGYESANAFLRANLFPHIEEIVAKRLWQDNKSRLQEESQERLGVTPSYRVVSEKGPDHDKRFTVGVFLGRDMEATGSGKSKQEAEQKAAQKALEKKGWLD